MGVGGVGWEAGGASLGVLSFVRLHSNLINRYLIKGKNSINVAFWCRMLQIIQSRILAFYSEGQQSS